MSQEQNDATKEHHPLDDNPCVATDAFHQPTNATCPSTSPVAPTSNCHNQSEDRPPLQKDVAARRKLKRARTMGGGSTKCRRANAHVPDVVPSSNAPEPPFSGACPVVQDATQEMETNDDLSVMLQNGGLILDPESSTTTPIKQQGETAWREHSRDFAPSPVKRCRRRLQVPDSAAQGQQAPPPNDVIVPTQLFPRSNSPVSVPAASSAANPTATETSSATSSNPTAPAAATSSEDTDEAIHTLKMDTNDIIAHIEQSGAFPSPGKIIIPPQAGPPELPLVTTTPRTQQGGIALRRYLRRLRWSPPLKCTRYRKVRKYRLRFRHVAPTQEEHEYRIPVAPRQLFPRSGTPANAPVASSTASESHGTMDAPSPDVTAVGEHAAEEVDANNVSEMEQVQSSNAMPSDAGLPALPVVTPLQQEEDALAVNLEEATKSPRKDKNPPASAHNKDATTAHVPTSQPVLTPIGAPAPSQTPLAPTHAPDPGQPPFTPTSTSARGMNAIPDNYDQAQLAAALPERTVTRSSRIIYIPSSSLAKIKKKKGVLVFYGCSGGLKRPKPRPTHRAAAVARRDDLPSRGEGGNVNTNDVGILLPNLKRNNAGKSREEDRVTAKNRRHTIGHNPEKKHIIRSSDGDEDEEEDSSSERADKDCTYTI